LQEKLGEKGSKKDTKPDKDAAPTLMSWLPVGNTFVFQPLLLLLACYVIMRTQNSNKFLHVENTTQTKVG